MLLKQVQCLQVQLICSFHRDFIHMENCCGFFSFIKINGFNLWKYRWIISLKSTSITNIYNSLRNISTKLSFHGYDNYVNILLLLVSDNIFFINRFTEVVKLIVVCWLDIKGKMETKLLSTQTTFVAYFCL